MLQPVDSSSCKQADNVNKKGETTLGQCVNQILIPFEEQNYSSVVGDSSVSVKIVIEECSTALSHFL